MPRCGAHSLLLRRGRRRWSRNVGSEVDEARISKHFHSAAAALPCTAIPAMEAQLEICLHLEKFKNIDLYSQGCVLFVFIRPVVHNSSRHHVAAPTLLLDDCRVYQFRIAAFTDPSCGAFRQQHASEDSAREYALPYNPFVGSRPQCKNLPE